ncbi:MAG: DEAD/DEAH box helicase [Armatimonadota bacterium]|nr:DEAD/DEAH box helicase [Armatimonadota bacterium]
MMHLVYHPSPAPRLFLWGRRPDGEAVTGPLVALGRPDTAQVVTDRGRARRVRGVAVDLLEGVAALAALEARDLGRAPASVAAWSLAAKLCLDLVARERVVPLVRRGPSGLEARWGVSLALPEDGERFFRLARSFPPAAHAVPHLGDAGASDGHSSRGRDTRASSGRAQGSWPTAIWTPQALLLHFADTVADALVRRAYAGLPGIPDSTGTLRRAGPSVHPRGNGEQRPWEERLIAALIGPDPTFGLEGFLGRVLPQELDAWAAPARGAQATSAPRLCLKLDPPAAASEPWVLHYFLQAPGDPSLRVPADRIWAARARLRWMDQTFEAPQEHLLKGLATAARAVPAIERSLETARPQRAALSTEEAWQFLSQGAPLLVESGVTVLLPAELTAHGQRRLRLRMRVGTGRAAPGVVPAGLSLDALVDFRWEAVLGDQTLSPEEFRELVALKRPLVRWRGQWVVLDPSEVTEIGRLLEQVRGGALPAPQALAAALAGRVPRDGEGEVEVVAEGALAALLDRLRAGVEPASPPPDLAGTLRHYQERGLTWLRLMAEVGLGGCLADDMGLGKTVQLIAFLLARRRARPDDLRPTLVVCPTSVLGNWERELARFAPTLPVVRHHGPQRSAEALRALPPHAVVVTTYALLRRDAAALSTVPWAVVALDEAQNIKNAAALQARAARALPASHRFALTGTPVENRLAELWSILDFCLPGLLGPQERFRRRFAVPIERYRDERAATELRRLVAPFVLRRQKSDPAILPDLPPKQEIPVICTLTREQATLYQAAVEEAMAKIEAAEGMQRRGLVLALLVALKQICNHPAHYLDEPGPLSGRSGKLDRLTEMLEEAMAAGDRALVFTQFREMGERLVAHLQQALQVEVLFLHGGVPRARRDRLVRRFQEGQGPGVFVLSLRAGGTGLNLARASRVFHFDRWWNPAVEDQATDRAHRIGQQRVVQVYRLLTAGTVEEKIDALLADKRALADRVIGAGEAWITELETDELRRLLALSADAPVGDDVEQAAEPARLRRRAR